MYSDKRVLLIAGGGTLGTYVAQELLRLGATVEIICPEEKTSDNERLIYHQSLATEELLKNLFAQKHYHGIVNFLHYNEVEDYRKIHPLLIENTDHLIFLSSYRVYANEQHPITESAPRLLDVIDDRDFLENEKYAVSKAKGEDYLRNERAGEPWTIVRPVISFSEKRFDLLMDSQHRILQAVAAGEELLLPELARNYTAGFDWAGNSGKLIANLLFKQDAMGNAYTIYSGHGMTWGEVAEVYQRLTGVKIRWCEEAEFVNSFGEVAPAKWWRWVHDRRYNRDVDCSNVLKATGLTSADFATVEEGIRYELKKLGYEK
ncbi:MAG: NAD-dependent epimerase/dehydratase family protein [Clostridia bacterium]|nr:NAD-dependent epimerase/dehydratase family protein [Clostridia bacterium]